MIGKISSYTVIRETDIGYILKAGGKEKDSEEFFLHRNECAGTTPVPGDKVNAFLYRDKKNRIAATLFHPIVEAGEASFLSVAGVCLKTGVFCRIGIGKDVLLSRADLPSDKRLWPRENDRILARLLVRNDRLVLKPLSKTGIIAEREKSFPETENKLSLGDNVEGTVYRLSDAGVNLVTDRYDIVFVHRNNLRRNVRFGETLAVRIIACGEEDYSGTTIKNKEFQIADDQKIILDYLDDHLGISLITEKSDSDLIGAVFKMSKAAFKKAVGGLLKQDKIEITPTKIILKDYKTEE